MMTRSYARQCNDFRLSYPMGHERFRSLASAERAAIRAARDTQHPVRVYAYDVGSADCPGDWFPVERSEEMNREMHV